MNRKCSLIIVLGIAAWATTVPRVLGDPLLERVTGQGEISVPVFASVENYTVSVAVAAFEDADGRIWGKITGFANGLCGGQISVGELASFVADVNCVDIREHNDFNEAWVYAVVTETGVGWGPWGTWEPPVGWPFIVYLRDHGNQDVDQMYMAHPLAFEGCVQDCGSQPNVMCCQGGGNDSAPSLVNGNFTVRSRSTKPTLHSGHSWSLVKRLYR